MISKNKLSSRSVICIFDRDNQKYINKVEENNGYKDWGNDTYSFSIPIPDHRTQYENISIEFYYTDKEIITKKENGTRLLFSNEINNVEGYREVRDNPVKEKEYSKKILDKDCSNIRDSKGNNVAHSKAVFADAILKYQYL